MKNKNNQMNKFKMVLLRKKNKLLQKKLDSIKWFQKEIYICPHCENEVVLEETRRLVKDVKQTQEYTQRM